MHLKAWVFAGAEILGEIHYSKEFMNGYLG